MDVILSANTTTSISNMQMVVTDKSDALQCDCSMHVLATDNDR